MLLQSLVVALVVALCSVYATWTLMPAGLRRGLATTLLGLPLRLPDALAAPLRLATHATTGCGACGGCAAAAPKLAGAVQPITFHPQKRINPQATQATRGR